MTSQEVKLWVHLRTLRELGFHFRRQSPIGAYIVDFECRKAMLVVEVDGGQHNQDEHRKRDVVRDVTLSKAGYQVLRFWNHEIKGEINAVMDVIHRALSARLEPPPDRSCAAATLP